MTRHLAAKRLVPLALAAALAAGCDDEPETPEDPPLAVPDHTVPDAPTMPQGMPTAMAAGATPPEYDPPLAVPGYDELPDPPMPQMPAGMQPGQMPPGMQPGQMPPGAQPGQMPQAGAPVPLAPGFSPDPMVTRGVAGGPVSAAAMNPSCAGYIAQQPSHVLSLASDFAQLRIVVSAQQDTTLVVRGPQGEYRCNDDGSPGEDLDPVVEGAFGAGAYSVWVGSYQQGVQAPYAIGFSEIPAVGPAQVAQAAQQLPAPPVPAN